MKTNFKLIIFLLIGAGTIYVLNNPIGQIPPPGKFLDPFNGVWKNALEPDIPKSKTLKMEGLTNNVQIVYNERGVPHIFAQNDHDLSFATGYAMARHRLWQMDLSSRAALGRLSEILGERTFEYDRYIRKTGMTYVAENTIDTINNDQTTKELLDAFTAGINAWINTLSPADYPLEYKLLGHVPEPWSNIKSAAIALSMSRALNFSTNSIHMSSLKAKWGEKAICAFYDTPPKYNEPVISYQDWDFPLVPPEPPKLDFIPQYILDAIVPEREPGVGSNNWAVSGNLTQSGFPILATDPHLQLTLPSVWYEMQINAPGVNAYGITFPGCVPSIAMGFNEKMAWGSTNTQNEVLDLYEIEFDESLSHYWYDNEWVPLTWHTETYTIKDGKTIIDSIAFTHHGPVMYMPGEKQYSAVIPIAHAISWAPLEACNFFKSYFQLNRAQNIDEFKHALSFLNAPTQNFGIATVSGDIAKQPNGLWPIKWEHQGMFISDGRNPEYDWKGFLPFEYLPYEVNPERGFVSSANQNMATNYPFYHGNSFFGTTARPNIINRKLSANKSHTIENMMELQLNCDNFWAQTYLDQMFDSLNTWYVNHSAPDVHSTEYKSLQILKNWNRINEAESIAATIFDRWIKELDTLLWKPLFEPINQAVTTTPSIDILFMVLFHEPPAHVYAELFGNLPATADLLAQSFVNTLTALEEELGIEQENWQWWKINGLTINHLLNIKALNHPSLMVGGSRYSPNAIRITHGPSWRMVVSLEDSIQAWGIYPGGQSGNPASKGYDQFVNDYAQGNYYPLKLYPSLENAAKENKTILILEPK